MTNARLQLQDVTFADVHLCAALDSLCFDAHCFSAEMIASLISSPQVFGFKLIEDGTPVGYSLISYVGEEGEILTIGIHPEKQGQGLGRVLLQAMLEKAYNKGVENIYLEVRESNVAAQNLYASFGGVQVGLRKNYYENPKENAKVLHIKKDR